MAVEVKAEEQEKLMEPLSQHLKEQSWCRMNNKQRGQGA